MYMIAAVPRMASGTVMPGMTVAAMSRRNTKMIATTAMIVRTSVNSTSFTDARMFWERSLIELTETVGGIAARSRGIAPMIRSTVSSTFAPGCFVIARMIVRSLRRSLSSGAPAPLNAHAATFTFSGPSTAVPMSRTRTGAPWRYARTTSFHGAEPSTWSFV